MLTITQRAERATKKRNKKIAQDYPLLAGQFVVTVESQVKRLEKQEIDNTAYFERLQIGNQRAWEKAIVYKEISRQDLPPELFADYERRYERIYGKRDYKDAGHCSADWWWCVLRDNLSVWAQEHCPNAVYHELDSFQQAGQCPTCKRHLTPGAGEQVATAPRQSSFISSESVTGKAADTAPTATRR